MFNKTNENDVRNDEGFEVRIRPGRWEIEYEEGERLITTGFEFLEGDPLIAVYPALMKVSDASPDSEELSVEESSRVLKRVLLALDFLGSTYELC